MHTMNPTGRFSNRVENYVKYRPGYPAAIVDFMRSELGLRASSAIADVGSGTGKLSELFLGAGHPVVGVEPNAEMRRAAEALLAAYPGFASVAGTAEETTLADSSVDFVLAGQAFHWFDRERVRPEFARVLRPGGWVLLVWNNRRKDASEFLRGYEDLLVRHCPEYEAMTGRDQDAGTLADFFGGEVREVRFENEQRFDLEGLTGRLLSSSYVPAEGPASERVVADLAALFHAHQSGGTASLVYDTEVYYGRMES